MAGLVPAIALNNDSGWIFQYKLVMNIVTRVHPDSESPSRRAGRVRKVPEKGYVYVTEKSSDIGDGFNFDCSREVIYKISPGKIEKYENTPGFGLGDPLLITDEEITKARRAFNSAQTHVPF